MADTVDTDLETSEFKLEVSDRARITSKSVTPYAISAAPNFFDENIKLDYNS